jgi:DNA-directed RNA polymerase specialized sigma24 family protein
VEEQALVDRAKAGDRIAMSHLYEAHSRRVYAVVRRLAGDDDLAADLSQDAWVRAFERIHLYRGEAAFGTWIHRLATNVALNRLRRRTKRPEVERSAVGFPTYEKPSDDAVISRRILRRKSVRSWGSLPAPLNHSFTRRARECGSSSPRPPSPAKQGMAYND